MFQNHHTICALSTPTGVGALGLIRVSGKDAYAIVSAIFKGKSLLQALPNSLVYGHIVDGDTLIDEVVLGCFRAPKSFTGEDVIEISCHGSAFILQKVMELLIQQGCKMAEPGEFSLRAFLNKKLDLSQTEAIADLIAAETEAQHKIAMHQMRGGFSKEIDQLRQELIDFAALVELELDFSEEDVEFADRTQLRQLMFNINQHITRLISSFELGNVIKKGVPVAIIGRPNAGKSTLLNALLNEDKALVTDIAGTTRDSIEDEMTLGGVQFRFIDTAGIRQTTDTVEQMGVQRAVEKMQQAGIVILLFDARSFGEADHQSLCKEVGVEIDDSRLILAANKADLLDKNAQAALRNKWPNAVLISAKSLQIDSLEQALLKKVNLQNMDLNATIVTNVRHADALRKARKHLEDALSGMDHQLSGELLAMDIRQSLYYLGLISGAITTDDLLGSIFSRFCIGK